jgi:hypothetical protein
MKPTKHCLKKGRGQSGKREYNGGSEHVQGTLYIVSIYGMITMKLSCNVNANSKSKISF